MFLLNDFSKIPGSKNDCRKAKKCQYHFTPFTTKFPAPGHSFIFNKIKFEPFQSRNICIDQKESWF